jgi:DNA-binding response OmpR family regulator
MARILIVDDEESVAWILTHYLRKAGHTAMVASDGQMALREANGRPDLILLDLGLPDLSGAEVLRRLKRNLDTAQIPVVIVSGEPDAAALVRDSGAHAVAAILRKPVILQELCDVVDSVLCAPAGWAEGSGPDFPEKRAHLLYRLITEGSNTLVRQVCLRLDADRRGSHEPRTAQAPNWRELARAGRREGLLSDGEGALLAAEPAVLAGSH